MAIYRLSAFWVAAWHFALLIGSQWWLNTKPPSLSHTGSSWDWINHDHPEQETEPGQLHSERPGSRREERVSHLIPVSAESLFICWQLSHSRQGSRACWSLETWAKALQLWKEVAKGVQGRNLFIPMPACFGFLKWGWFILQLSWALTEKFSCTHRDLMHPCAHVHMEIIKQLLFAEHWPHDTHNAPGCTGASSSNPHRHSECGGRGSRYYYPCFTDEELKSQKGIFPKIEKLK